jgi:large subunit ribosomal protein L3
VSIGILGIKIGMTQIFDKNGLAIPITVIKAGPCFITQIKEVSTNGYNAIQIGFSEKKTKKIKKTEKGHFNKSTNKVFSFLKEYHIEKPENFVLGQSIDVTNFSINQFVNITGRSIGKGFTSLQKRYHFARGPMTHGSKNHRAPGSIGAGTTPGRVFPGKKMSGRSGNNNTTISNLEILGIDKKENLLLLKGTVPGKSGNLVSIISSLKKSK